MKSALVATLTALLVAPILVAGHPAIVIVNGRPLTRTQMNRVHEIVVTQEVRRPDTCELRFSGPTPSSITNALKLGLPLEVQVNGDSRPASVFKGEIVSVEPIYGKSGDSTVVVRGFDSLHRLSRARRTRTWVDVSEIELFVEIGTGHGFRVEAEDPGFRSEFIYQNNQTDLEFLRQRAARIGFLLDADGDVLRVTAAATAFPDPPALTRFEPLELTDRDLPGPLQVMVRGWDPVRKEELVGEATADSDQSGPGITFFYDSGDELSEEPSNSENLVYSRVELEAVTQARLRERVHESRSLRGSAPGDPRLQAGITVELDILEDRFNGKYFLQGVTHKFSRSKYTTLLRLVREAESR